MKNREKDKYRLVPKLLNIFTMGYDSVWRNFNPIWYENHGLNPFNIGLIRSMRIIGIIFGPLWSVMADKTRKRKQILSGILIGAILTLKILDYFPSIYKSNLNITITIFFYTVFWVGIRPLTEGIILTSLGDNKELFGRQTTFSALGWLVSCVITGYLYTWYGYPACWNLQLFCVIIALIILNFYVDDFKKEEINEMDKIPFFTKLNTVVKELYKPKVLKILMVLVVQGAGSNMIQSFLFVYLNKELDAPKYICGWTIFFTCLFELPVFFYAHKLLDIFGINVLFITAQLAFIIRTFLYTFLTKENILWVLPIELLHGLTFANMWTSATQFASEFCPKGLESICMLILALCYYHLGSFLGNIIGGILYTHYGAIVMFHCFGYFHLLICIIFTYRCYLEYSDDKIKKNIIKDKLEKEIELLDIKN